MGLSSLLALLSLSSCAGFEELKKAQDLPLTPTPEPTVTEDGTVLNSEGIDFNDKYKTFLNVDQDPYQKQNRLAFNVNYYILDKYILRPLAVANREIVSPDLESALVNASYFFNEPFTLAANLLTKQPLQARNNLTRLVLNGVFGLGMIDWASELGFFSNYANADSVMAYYGYRPGSYIMLPGFGPTYPRKFVSNTLLANSVKSFGYARAFSNYSYWSLPLTAYSIVSLRSNMLDQEPLLVNTPDPYSVVKQIYIQNQNFQQSKALGIPVPESQAPEVDSDILNLIN